AEQLRPYLGEVDVDPAADGNDISGEEVPGGPESGAVRSPGMKYRHYAPRTPCFLFEGPAPAVADAMAARVRREREQGRRVGVLVTRESAPTLDADAVCIVGGRWSPAEVAHNLYRCLRELDEATVDVIFMEGIDPKGIGVAVMNRMRR